MGVHALKRAAVFLDRDGVLNRAPVGRRRPSAPLRLEDFEILPDVPDALARLKSAGYALVVVTNQPDVARGHVSREIVEAMHARLSAVLPLDEIRVCYHDKADACSCRKPAPGLLLEPPTYDVGASTIVGDRWRDVEAGRRAGCRATILVDYDYDEPLPNEPDVRVHSLAEAADWILSIKGKGHRSKVKG
ncbi:MAG: HAD-IIIA family hydrolase [Acidobacteria bacterium]|nr:MAG: HAD-IIIA family hydrolase [Acidobacteriota bacterium]